MERNGHGNNNSGEFSLLEIEIREIKSADGPMMIQFLRSLSYSTQYDWNDFGLLTNIDHIRNVSKELCLPRPDREFRIVAVSGNKIVGLAYLMFFPEKTFKSDNCKFGIVIADGYQGKGIGSQMMHRIIEEAKTRKMRKIWLTTYLDNERGLRFFQKFGFIIQGFFFNDENWKGVKRTPVSMALFLDQNERKKVLQMRNELIKDLMT